MWPLIPRNCRGWVPRPLLPPPAVNRRNGNYLLNVDRDRPRNEPRSGIPVNADGIAGAGMRRTLRSEALSAARNGKQTDSAEHADQDQALHGPSSLHVTYRGETGYSEGQAGAGVQSVPVPVMKIQTRDGSRGNGKS